MRYAIVCVLITLFSCQSRENNSIVGSWQLIGSKYGTGAEVI